MNMTGDVTVCVRAQAGVCAWVGVCARAQAGVCARAGVYVCARVCARGRVCVCACTRACVCVCVCVRERERVGGGAVLATHGSWHLGFYIFRSAPILKLTWIFY